MRALTAHIAMLSLLAMPTTPLAAAHAGRPAPPAAKPAGSTRPPGDGGWPRTYTTPAGATAVLYQPQVASWVDQKHMKMYAALSYAKAGQPAALGTIGFESTTHVAVADRLVDFSDLRVTESNFPSLEKDAVKAVVADIVGAVPKANRVISLDRVLAAVDSSQITPKNTSGVKADPPIVFFSQTPAILVNIDGNPIWNPIAGNDLRFAVNTNWDLLEHPPSKSFYLRDDKAWLMAPSVDGPWRRAGTLPASFAALPADGNWDDLRAALPAKDIPVGQLPAVFVSRSPAELIAIDGAPQFVPVKGTKLSWVSNTDSDLFRGPDGSMYFLTSGRWFSASTLSGPWTFATLTLPEDFKHIPVEHPRSRVLASVPGTREALEAVLLAQVPQTAKVSRRDVVAPAVAYQGKPQFDPIERTTVTRAVNTDKDVFMVGDRYYMCYQGVWFIGSSPTGPWTVADVIPQEIYQIPSSSPAHNVTYVTVESSDDDYVEFAAEAAYTGLMVAWGCAVWGSGYYYPPYVGWAGGYPAYFPYYPTYGYGARYNPWTGAYSAGAGVYGPYGGAGFGARYNPSTGTYARGAVAYGPGGARGAAQAYNPRTGTSAGTIQGSSAYGSWGSTAVKRGDNWAQTSRVTRNATGTTTRATQGSGGGSAVSRRGPEGGGFAGKTAGGDMYAGRDGNVYRNQGGSWQKYSDGGWNNVGQNPAQRPTGSSGQLGTTARDAVGTGGNRTTIDQLNRDRGARVEGKQRTSDFGRASKSGGGASSYRPSGGGMRMGGGMRGGGRR